MTLWQVLLGGEPLDALLDTLAEADPQSLAVMHSEARAGLVTLGAQGLGTLDPGRAAVLVEDLRLLAVASLPWSPGGRQREAEVDRLVSVALERIRQSDGQQRMIHEGRRLIRVGRRTATA